MMNSMILLLNLFFSFNAIYIFPGNISASCRICFRSDHVGFAVTACRPTHRGWTNRSFKMSVCFNTCLWYFCAAEAMCSPPDQRKKSKLIKWFNWIKWTFNPNVWDQNVSLLQVFLDRQKMLDFVFKSSGKVKQTDTFELYFKAN